MLYFTKKEIYYVYKITKYVIDRKYFIFKELALLFLNFTEDRIWLTYKFPPLIESLLPYKYVYFFFLICLNIEMLSIGLISHTLHGVLKKTINYF